VSLLSRGLVKQQLTAAAAAASAAKSPASISTLPKTREDLPSARSREHVYGLSSMLASGFAAASCPCGGWKGERPTYFVLEGAIERAGETDMKKNRNERKRENARERARRGRAEESKRRHKERE
jgi:hypothetical protein